MPNKILQAPGADPQDSGVLLLEEELSALTTRLAMAASARSSIDVQYYIWTGDAVGIAVIKQLLNAAMRGVRIRLLVDDIHFIGYDRRVLGLDAYDNVEIRSFNPFRYRFSQSPLRSMAEIFSGAARLNHRMHNKVFAVDRQAAVLGGRNLSNEYFGAGAALNFRDIDVLTVGPTVTSVMASFDEFWDSPWAIPLKELHKIRIKPVEMPQLEEGLADEERALLAQIESLLTPDYLQTQQELMTWCPVEVLADSPIKAAGEKDFASPVRERLFLEAYNAKHELLIENGYFIPRDEGMRRLTETVQRGVHVQVLTNSLASNDTGISHAGYKRYRTGLMQAGVALYELRADADLAKDFELARRPDTSVSLHSKAAVIDRHVTFVGSYNLDPRSAFINTEIGLLIYDQAFAEQCAAFIKDGMQPNNCWRVSLTSNKTLRWQHEITLDHEPPARPLRPLDRSLSRATGQS